MMDNTHKHNFCSNFCCLLEFFLLQTYLEFKHEFLLPDWGSLWRCRCGFLWQCNGDTSSLYTATYLWFYVTIFTQWNKL
jgi:hypothetical protein